MLGVVSRGWSARALVVATALGWGAVTAPSVVGVASPASAADVTATAPSAFWPLDDATAATAHDTVGGHDGVVGGTVTAARIAQGPGATAFGFDGTSGVIHIAAAGLAPGTSAASAWLRTSEAAAVGTVLDTGGVAIGLVGGRAAARSCWDAGACATVLGPAVGDGVWHQVALSVSGTTASLYVDGVLTRTGATQGTTAAPADDTVAIGRGFHGDIDRVAVYAAPVSASTVAADFRHGACPQAVGSSPVSTASRRLPALPLHTRGRYVVDAHGHRVKLAGVNWYGAEELDHVPAGLQCQTVDAIASRIVADGYDVVRLLWATDTWVGSAPAVPPVAVAANPALRGLDARAVFDRVVAALARHGLMVILDNHVSRSDWCCSGSDGNALWWEGYDPAHPPAWRQMSPAARTAYFLAGEHRWLTAWRRVATRYRGQRAVVGADLRNEPRSDNTLGIRVAWTNRRVAPARDWARAATRAGNALLRIRPSLLIAVEGIDYATGFVGARQRPIRLRVAHRVVYSAHEYSWFSRSATTPARLRTELDRRWGWLLTRGHSWTAPVWVGEFGTCHPEEAGCTDTGWFPSFISYLHRRDLEWTYWSFNGTSARGTGDPVSCGWTPRFPGCSEGYGLSDAAWARDVSPSLSRALRSVVRPSR